MADVSLRAAGAATTDFAGGEDPADTRRRGFEVREICDIGAWRAVANHWDRLLRATEGYTGLQSSEFLITWWEHMGGDHKLWILGFYDRGELVGIAPLQIASRRLLGKQYRVVEFLAMPEEILLPTLLFPSDYAPALRAAFVDYLADHKSEWDHVKLDEIADDSPLLASLRGLSARCRLIHREAPLHACPFLELADENVEAFWARRSRKLWKNVRAGERKLRKLGDLALKTYASPHDIGEGFRLFMEVEQRSWKREERLGIASDDRYEGLYIDLLSRFARGDGARAMVLTLDGRPIAATLGVLFDGVYCSLQIVHDPQYRQCSPGTVLESYEMEALIKLPTVKRYEFLGGAPSNKVRWTSDAVGSVYVHARKLDVRSAVVDVYRYRARPLAKGALNKAGVSVPALRGAFRWVEQASERLLGRG